MRVRQWNRFMRTHPNPNPNLTRRGCVVIGDKVYSPAAVDRSRGRCSASFGQECAQGCAYQVREFAELGGLPQRAVQALP